MRGPLRPSDPRRIGDYRLDSRLGQGGMGTVYLGFAPDGRPVAIKVIKPELAYEEEFRARFRSEVNRARQVPPFCTAELLDADADHETPYLVVEYVDGPSLADVVTEQGPLTGGNLYSVAVGVATALAAIHGAGVIHRDLKPRNVLFALGTPKVIDFGIARAFEATSQHTGTDQMVGTVAYMAPERFDAGTSRAVGPAADVFAWGVVVTYAGTGRTPFTGDSAAATAARILTQPPDLGDLPAPLRDLVASTLEKDPARRPSAAQLLDLLVAAREAPAGFANRPELRHAAQAVRMPPADERTTVVSSRRRRWGRVAPVLAAIGIAGVLAAGVVAFTPVRSLVEADGGRETTAIEPDPSSPAPPPSSAPPSEPATGPSAVPSRTTDADPEEQGPAVAPTLPAQEIKACRSADMAVTITAQPADSAFDPQKALVTVANASAARCVVDGRAFVTLYNAADEKVTVPTRSVNEPGAADEIVLPPRGAAYQGIKWQPCDRGDADCPAGNTLRASLDGKSRGVVAEQENFGDPGSAQITMSSLQLGTLQLSRQGVVAW